ncbi:MAG: GNAT family N-acetyltransferase [Actinomycetota bacterium]|nr:GNAT family N-acetyltransferase [Actinomycetota bacterium]
MRTVTPSAPPPAPAASARSPGLGSFPCARAPTLRRRDADAVRELHDLALADGGAHVGSGPWDDDLRSIRRSYLQDGGEFLVGLLNGRLVAMGALRHVTAAVAEIKRMRVHPRFQRRGFGSTVLARLEDRARQLGDTKLRLDTTIMQTAAQALYAREGYSPVGRGQLAGVEVIYYEKRLR